MGGGMGRGPEWAPSGGEKKPPASNRPHSTINLSPEGFFDRLLFSKEVRMYVLCPQAVGSTLNPSQMMDYKATLVYPLPQAFVP